MHAFIALDMNILEQILSAHLLNKWWGNNIIKLIISCLFHSMGTAMSGEVCHFPCAHVICISPGMAHLLFSSCQLIISPISPLLTYYFSEVPISCIYSFSHYIILMRIHVVLERSGNSWNSWMCLCSCQTRIYSTMKCYNKWSSMKIFAKHSDISCHVLHDLWPPKSVNFRDFKLIIGRINLSYCSPLFCISAPTDSGPVVWLGIVFISKCM